MKKAILFTTVIMSVLFSAGGCVWNNSSTSTSEDLGRPCDKLAVLWTSGDPDVAYKVCFMYTHNAKKAGWFDQVELIVWGPSSKLLSQDESLKAKVKTMIADGVSVTACKACADSYGVSGDLTAIGIDVKYMGVPLSDMLKADWKVITF